MLQHGWCERSKHKWGLRPIARFAALLVACILVAGAAAAALTGCGSQPASQPASQTSSQQPAGQPAKHPATESLRDYPASDMSGYACAANYTGTYQFVDMTVKDVVAQMDAGSSFVLFAGYQDCGWCNVALNHLNDAATECGVKVGYLNTRKNPAWQSNTDIDDYDLLVERFGEQVGTDDNGQVHLYVPVVFFVKDGKPSTFHSGTVPEQEKPSDPLTPEQQQALKATYTQGIQSIC